LKRIKTDENLAVFEVPCSVCGKPVIVTHEDRAWGDYNEDYNEAKTIESFLEA